MLIECRECRGKVSTNARFCPHCGARHFRYPVWPRWAALVVALAAVIVFFDPIVRYGYWGFKQGVVWFVNYWGSGGP
jgi:hypothetical protein